MKILVLAPHPFYQERGTPIAVDLLLSSLSDRGDEIHVLTYHEGEDKTYPGVHLHRIKQPPGIRNIRPGLSFKKLVCDFFMFWKAASMRRNLKPELVHAIEESVFMALVFKRFHGTPYVYDMDSSLAGQVVESKPWLKFMASLFNAMEGMAVKHATAVVPVCKALADIAEAKGARRITLLTDISLLREPGDSLGLKERFKINGVCFMYIGNLEPYQGIDLMLESFRNVARQGRVTHLVIIGGLPEMISDYQAMVARLSISDRVHFTGPLPPSRLADIMTEADVLVSPRCGGDNTPMKIYSYLDSGKPVLATDLYTHTQVLTNEVAMLAAPDPESFAEAMIRLIDDPGLRDQLGEKARDLIQREYSMPAFRQKVHALYDDLKQELKP